jgi:hypothetical protein
MDATFTVPANVLLGMSHLTGEEIVRNNITGLHLEKRDGNIRIVATDGHLLGLFEIGESSIEWLDGAAGYESADIPIANFIPILKDAAKGKHVQAVKVSLNGTAKMEHFGQTIEAPYLDNDFPDWQQIFSCRIEEPIPSIGIASDKIRKFEKALSVLTGSKTQHMRFRFSGEESVMHVTGNTSSEGTFNGLLMPVRTH